MAGVKELSECRVLVVDDMKANVDMLVEALRGEHKLSVALDGEAALRAVQKSPPDLLLLDIVMPGLDGYEVCRRLRADPATREIPIMFLSSLEDVKDKAKGFELGANDYLTKPFEILEVKARVRSLLKAKAYADAIRAAQERDLAIAREIQMGILPSDIPARVRGTGLDVHATIEPARHVGGDLFEVLRLSDDRLVMHRKPYEFTQLLFGCRRLGVLRDDAAFLSVGAGHEHVLYWLANHVRRVVATDRRIVDGTPARVETLRRRSQGEGVINTAYIERLNATFRERLASLTRRGRALARRTRTLQHGM